MKLQQRLFTSRNGNQILRSVAQLRFRVSNVDNLKGQTRSTSTSSYRCRLLETLHDATIDNFREKCFNPERPAILPRESFRDSIPAFERWFLTSSDNNNISRLNVEYLQNHSGDAFVPLELTQLPPPPPHTNSNDPEPEPTFRRFHAPLSLFLQWIQQTPPQTDQTRLYLAQCHLLDLPQTLHNDLPTPPLVSKSGRGDIYDTNIWIGLPPTYTPLHRDPNPNLFVQLAGRKIVRLLPPGEGLSVFGSVRRELGWGGSREDAAFRGEEMMQGGERRLLERVVWGDPVGGSGSTGSGSNGPGSVDGGKEFEGYEAVLGAGDGLFIPKGWWHSIKGVGEGVTASVNWWFR